MKNLTMITGDLLEGDFDAIVHQANCQIRMRSGVAKAITDMYPEVRTADEEFPTEKGYARLGHCSLAFVEHKKTGKELVVGNLYGQLYYGGVPGVVYTQYKHLADALKQFVGSLRSVRPNKTGLKIGIPFRMGAGLAGGKWADIYDIIEKVANDNPDIEFIITKLP